MPGPTPKVPRRKQGHRKHRRLELAKRSAIPFPPAGMLKRIREQWVAVWKSPVAKTWDEQSDMAAVERLFTMYDERARAYRQIRKDGRLVLGSKGQPRLDPLAGYIAGLDGAILALEDRLGLSPRSRLQLGITLADAYRSLDGRNSAIDDMEDEDDPRALNETQETDKNA